MKNLYILPLCYSSSSQESKIVIVHSSSNHLNPNAAKECHTASTFLAKKLPNCLPSPLVFGSSFINNHPSTSICIRSTTIEAGKYIRARSFSKLSFLAIASFQQGPRFVYPLFQLRRARLEGARRKTYVYRILFDIPLLSRWQEQLPVVALPNGIHGH